MTEAALQQYIQAIRPADRAVMDAARKRQAELAKPPGSLGTLEDMSIRLAGITGQVCPKMDSCRVAVFAADNGVVDEGVSCAPRSVTLQQAINMTRRRTGMSAMAAAFGDDVAVVDVGIAADVPGVGILDRKVRRGTGNIAVEDAMTRPEALAAMAAGMEQARAPEPTVSPPWASARWGSATPAPRRGAVRADRGGYRGRHRPGWRTDKRGLCPQEGRAAPCADASGC